MKKIMALQFVVLMILSFGMTCVPFASTVTNANGGNTGGVNAGGGRGESSGITPLDTTSVCRYADGRTVKVDSNGITPQSTGTSPPLGTGSTTLVRAQQLLAFPNRNDYNSKDGFIVNNTFANHDYTYKDPHVDRSSFYEALVGNFDGKGNGSDELLMIYMNSGNAYLWTDLTGTPHERLQHQFIISPLSGDALFYWVAEGDFGGNGTDEVALLSLSMAVGGSNPPHGWTLDDARWIVYNFANNATMLSHDQNSAPGVKNGCELPWGSWPGILMGTQAAQINCLSCWVPLAIIGCTTTRWP